MLVAADAERLGAPRLRDDAALGHGDAAAAAGTVRSVRTDR
jgi:hypothetical protein